MFHPCLSDMLTGVWLKPKEEILLAKVCFVSMWHSIVPASVALLHDELVALYQHEEKLEFWFHGCHSDTDQWLLNEIIRLKACNQSKTEIVDVVDPFKEYGNIRDKTDQLWQDNFKISEDVRIEYAPKLDSKINPGSRRFIVRSNQVERWMIDQCDYLLAYYYDGVPNGATTFIRHARVKPHVRLISVVDPTTVMQIEKLVTEIDGRTRLILDRIRAGRSYQSIGDELGVSPNRVMQIASKASRNIMYAIHGEIRSRYR